MYKLELDLEVVFSPPMNERDRGVKLTRTLELPFVPTSDIQLYSAHMETVGSEPTGFIPKDIIWDIDKQVFLARAFQISMSVPFTLIPEELAEWVKLGWRFGSYVDQYGTPETRVDKYGEPKTRIPATRRRDFRDDSELDDMLKQDPRGRTPYFNEVFGSIIRTMVENYADPGTAYAMDRTGRYFTESELTADNSEIARKWRDLQWNYGKLTDRRKRSWQMRVVHKYHSLEAIVQKILQP